MAEFQVAQSVIIPCDVQPGPFPTGKLVTIRTDAGETSGFVRLDFLIEQPPGTWQVLGQVQAVEHDRIAVRLPGHFFTTASGMTSVSSAWARQYLHEAPAHP